MQCREASYTTLPTRELLQQKLHTAIILSGARFEQNEADERPPNMSTFQKYETYKDSGVEWLGAGLRKRLNGPFKPQMSQMDTDSETTQLTSHAASVLSV